MHQYPIGSAPVGSSFRDPSGYVFEKNGIFYRGITASYRTHWESFMQSGLYRVLTKRKLLIPHQEVRLGRSSFYKIIKPTQIPFISYPYEWCFSQLKDAALTTLHIQQIALQHNMTLKDASAYNMQFFEGKPLLIDSLSFERYIEGKPWVAYRQFCMHFLVPLLLMKYTNNQLNKLTQVYIDGIPLNMASSLLPMRTWLNPFILTHIHLHSKLQSHLKRKIIDTRTVSVSKKGLAQIISQLERGVTGLTLTTTKGDWTEYYRSNNYTHAAFNAKKAIVSHYIQMVRPRTVWDFGANTGAFSHAAAKQGINTIAFDNDPLSVERNYVYCKNYGLAHCLPLVVDITNPSPKIGWHNEERMSLWERGPSDVVLCLALVHHLAISHNIPFEKIAGVMAQVSRYVIIEFIEKSDTQVQQMLQNRQDIFYDYIRDTFESAFQKKFVIQSVKKIPHAKRFIYLMKNKQNI